MLTLKITKNKELSTTPLDELLSKENKISIGRGKDNTIIVEDDHISDCHAFLVKINDTYKLVDNSSTNGIWTPQKVRVKDYVFNETFSVLMGDTLFEFIVEIDPDRTVLEDNKIGLSNSQINNKTYEKYFNYYTNILGNLNTEKDDKDRIDNVLQHLINVLNADTVGVFIQQFGSDKMELSYLKTLKEGREHLKWSTSLVKKTYENQTIFFEGSVSDNFTITESIMDMDCESILSCPISTSQVRYGVLMATSSKKPSPFNKKSEIILRTTCNLLGILFERIFFNKE